MTDVETDSRRESPALVGNIMEVRGINGNRSGTRRGRIHWTICDMGRSAQPLEEEPFQGIDRSLAGSNQDLINSTDGISIQKVGNDNRRFHI